MAAKSFMSSYMTYEKTKFVLSTIILGAIGSGVWSYIGDPSIKWVAENYISAAHYLNNGYYDYLHSKIGNGQSQEIAIQSMYKLNIIYILVIALIAISFSLSNFIDNSKTSASILSKFFIIFASIMLLQTMATGIKDRYNNNAVVFLERSIEILSPNYDTKITLELRAEYRSIENASDFYLLYDKIIALGNQKNIRLPNFEVAR